MSAVRTFCRDRRPMYRTLFHSYDISKECSLHSPASHLMLIRIPSGNSEMRKVRHSRAGGNPVLLAITLLDSRLRGNDRLANSRVSWTLCYSFGRTFVSEFIRLRFRVGRPKKPSPREPADFDRCGRRKSAAMTSQVRPFSYSTESRAYASSLLRL